MKTLKRHTENLVLLLLPSRSSSWPIRFLALAVRFLLMLIQPVRKTFTIYVLFFLSSSSSCRFNAFIIHHFHIRKHRPTEIIIECSHYRKAMIVKKFSGAIMVPSINFPVCFRPLRSLHA